MDEPWQFSRLWLLGVDSITTSNAQVMADLDHPIFSLPNNLFILLWAVVGLLGLRLIFGLNYSLINTRPVVQPSPPPD